jgi:hypothetical protein
MDTDYFDEFVKATAYRVNLGSWTLFNGLPPVALVGPSPVKPFRLAITVSASGTHDTVEGTITVGDEAVEFAEASRHTTEEELTALPDIEVEGLDCNILVECISTAGTPLQKETLTPIEIVCFPKTRLIRDASGSGYQETSYDIWATENLAIGDQIRYTDPHQGTTIDIYVKDIGGAVDLEDNTQPFRVLYCA